jgi:4-hydroxy-2,2'-bipyrrole-5-carbaldehyde O-methyltransferase
LQPGVAELTTKNIARWKLHDRARTEVGDIRENAFGERFDIVTLYNNIYCFPVEDRISLLRLIEKFLRPHDLLLLTTGCQGENLGIEVLNLWGQPLKLQEDCRTSMK